jgi:hypothetical protein
MRSLAWRVALFVSALSLTSRAEEVHPFRDGQFDGGLRTYFMATQNRDELKDWYSLALGGRLGYHTDPIAGFGAGASIYATRALVGNSDEVDATTSRPSRYELGLYDMTDPSNPEVALLGQAYVDFQSDGVQLWAGRHVLNTPLFNPQDGRMIPTLAQGIWYSGTLRPGGGPSSFGLQAGYISHVAPRGDQRFRPLEDSFGIFPVGRNLDGTPSGYAGNVDSKGLFVGSLSYGHELLEVNVWDYFAENVFNTVYSDLTVKPRFAGLDWRFGLQHLLQHRVQDGGNPEADLAYFQHARSQALGGQIRAETASKWRVSASYDRITSAGRFVFPREWGKEPLFVFQKRERSEGSGDLQAWLIQLGKVWNFEQDGKLRTQLGYGQYYRTDPHEPEFNKYGFHSLSQTNLDTFYHFGEPLSGLVAELLVTYKGKLGDASDDNPAFVLNKVDMFNWNFIVNYEL